MESRTGIDLGRFCRWAPDALGLDLETPFSFAGWTYATNRQLCVRVPRVWDYGFVGRRPSSGQLIRQIATAARGVWGWLALDLETLPGRPLEPEGECDFCLGHGHGRLDWDDPIEEAVHVPGETCRACCGSGLLAKAVPVATAAGLLNWRWLCELSKLPGIELGVPGTWEPAAGVAFRFDGGDGVVMPMDCREGDGYYEAVIRARAAHGFHHEGHGGQEDG